MLMLFYSEDADLAFRIQIGRLRVEGARNNLNLLPLHELTSSSSLQPYSVTPRLRTSRLYQQYVPSTSLSSIKYRRAAVYVSRYWPSRFNGHLWNSISL